MSNSESEPSKTRPHIELGVISQEEYVTLTFDELSRHLEEAEPIYVGVLGIEDHISGATVRKLQLATRARQIADQALRSDDPDPLSNLIAECTEIIDGPTTLNPITKNAIATTILFLVTEYDQPSTTEEVKQ